MPKRGIAALAITAFALVLLLSFKTPDVVPARGGGVAVVEPGTGTGSSANAGTGSGSTAAQAPGQTTAPTKSTGNGSNIGRRRYDRRAGRRHTLWRGPGRDRRLRWSAEGRRRTPAPDRSSLRPDLDRCCADPPPGGASGKERSDRHSLWGDVYERRLRAVAPGGARPGRSRMSVAVVGGLRWVEHVMGTTVSIAVEPPLVSEEVIKEVVADLHDVDARFSTYRPDSEISRLDAGRAQRSERQPRCSPCPRGLRPPRDGHRRRLRRPPAPG